MFIKGSNLLFEFSDLGVEVGAVICLSETFECRCFLWAMPNNHCNELLGSCIYCLHSGLLYEVVALFNEVVELICSGDNVVVNVWWFFGGGG